MQIKRKSEYHTIFGSIISVAIMSFITYSFISLVVDLFERQNPNIISNLVFNKNPSEFILNQKDYFFAVTVADEYGVPIVQKPNQTIYGVDLDLCWRHPDVNGNVSAQCQTFRLQSCLSLNISQDMISVLDVSQQTLKYSFCLDPLIWANPTISLEGTATSQHFKYMFVRILKCNSTVFTEQCASDQIISSTLNRGYIALLMADRLLNQNQIGYPYKTILKSISTTFTVTQYKSLSVILRKSSFQNYENFFYYFGVLNEYETLQQEQQVEQVEYTPRNEIVSALIYLDEKQIIYYRTYDNILNILGSIGGLLELMGLLLGFLIKPLNNLAANLFLANQVFKFDFSDQSNAQIYPQLELNNNNNNNNSNNNNQKNNLLKFIESIKTNTKRQRLNLFQYFCNQSEKKKIIQMSIDQIYQKIDIQFILNKFIEIDKLKKILLTVEQQQLFNHIHKPNIALRRQSNTIMKKSRIHNLYDQIELSEEEQILNAFESYKILIENQSFINQNILNLMDKVLKGIFDSQLTIKEQSIVQQVDLSNLQTNKNQQNDFMQELDEMLQM